MPDPIVEGGELILTQLLSVVDNLMTGIVDVWTTIVSNETIQPYFLLGIGISLVLVAVKVIRSVVWGA